MENIKQLDLVYNENIGLFKTIVNKIISDFDNDGFVFELGEVIDYKIIGNYTIIDRMFPNEEDIIRFESKDNFIEFINWRFPNWFNK